MLHGLALKGWKCLLLSRQETYRGLSNQFAAMDQVHELPHTGTHAQRYGTSVRVQMLHVNSLNDDSKMKWKSTKEIKTSVICQSSQAL